MSNRTETGEMVVWATGFVCDAEVCMVEGVEGYVLLHTQHIYAPAQMVSNTGRADVQFTRSDGAVFSYRWVDPDEVPVPRLSSWIDRDIASAWLQEMVKVLSLGAGSEETKMAIVDLFAPPMDGDVARVLSTVMQWLAQQENAGARFDDMAFFLTAWRVVMVGHVLKAEDCQEAVEHETRLLDLVASFSWWEAAVALQRGIGELRYAATGWE